MKYWRDKSEICNGDELLHYNNFYQKNNENLNHHTKEFMKNGIHQIKGDEQIVMGEDGSFHIEEPQSMRLSKGVGNSMDFQNHSIGINHQIQTNDHA